MADNHRLGRIGCGIPLFFAAGNHPKCPRRTGGKIRAEKPAVQGDPCRLAAPLLLTSACIKLKQEMTIQPVHITVDVTIQIDRELDNFFADIDKAAVNTVKDGTSKKEELK